MWRFGAEVHWSGQLLQNGQVRSSLGETTWRELRWWMEWPVACGAWAWRPGYNAAVRCRTLETESCDRHLEQEKLHHGSKEETRTNLEVLVHTSVLSWFDCCVAVVFQDNVWRHGAVWLILVFKILYLQCWCGGVFGRNERSGCGRHSGKSAWLCRVLRDCRTSGGTWFWNVSFSSVSCRSSVCSSHLSAPFPFSFFFTRKDRGMSWTSLWIRLWNCGPLRWTTGSLTVLWNVRGTEQTNSRQTLLCNCCFPASLLVSSIISIESALSPPHQHKKRLTTGRTPFLIWRFVWNQLLWISYHFIFTAELSQSQDSTETSVPCLGLISLISMLK